MVVCRSLIVLCLFFTLVIVLHIVWDIRLLVISFVTFDYTFGILWFSLWYLLVTPLVFFNHPLVPSVNPFGALCLPLWYLLVTPLVPSSYPFGVFWSPFDINCLPLWYILVTSLFPSGYPLFYSAYPFVTFSLILWYLLIVLFFGTFCLPIDIFWLPLWYLLPSYCYLLITSLVPSDYHLWYLLVTPFVTFLWLL